MKADYIFNTIHKTDNVTCSEIADDRSWMKQSETTGRSYEIHNAQAANARKIPKEFNEETKLYIPP